MDRITECPPRGDILVLWSEVFGDSFEEISFFLDNCRGLSCLAYYCGDSLASMLFLVDSVYCGSKGKYIYAVCTKPEFRCKGFSSALINKAKHLDSDFLWLIPASDELLKFYKSLGFSEKLFFGNSFEPSVLFDQSDDIIEYLYSGCEMETPVGLLYSMQHYPDGNLNYPKGE